MSVFNTDITILLKLCSFLWFFYAFRSKNWCSKKKSYPYSMSINFHLCRFLCQKASLLFWDPHFLFFLFSRTFFASLWWFNFNITFLGFPLDDKRWQSSTNPGSTGASVSSRMLLTLVSISLSLTIAVRINLELIQIR